MTNDNKLFVPDGYIFISAATDLNVSYGATTVISAFKRDMTCHVLYHHITKCRIDSCLNDTEYNKLVYSLLVKVGENLKSLNLKIDGWSIDGSGRNFDSVCLFSKNSYKLCGIPACPFLGRSSNIFNPYVRTRLRNAVGRTVLCGNE
jgi:hypothetical protein